MSGDEPLHGLEGAFLEAAVLPELWPAALDMVARVSGASGANFVPPSSGAPRPLCSPGMADLFEPFIAEGWFLRNSHLERGMRLVQAGWKGVITERDSFTLDELKHDPFQQDLMVRHGFGSSAGGLLAESGGLALPLSVARRLELEPFSPAERANLNRIFDRLRFAGSLALRVGFAAAAAVADAFARQGQEIALLSQQGRVLHMSAGFPPKIGDGLLLANGILKAAEFTANEALTAAIGRALGFGRHAEPGCATVVVPRRSGRRALVLEILPVAGHAHDLFNPAYALVILTDLEERIAGVPQPETIQQALGLSRAEARLAWRVGRGERIDTIAAAEGITHETVRSRLKSVFAKTRTNRQSELALLVRSVPSRG